MRWVVESRGRREEERRADAGASLGIHVACAAPLACRPPVAGCAFAAPLLLRGDPRGYSRLTISPLWRDCQNATSPLARDRCTCGERLEDDKWSK